MSGSRTPLVRLGYLASIQSGITVDGNRSDGPDDVTLPYLRVANVQDGHLDLGTITEIRVPKSLAHSAALKRGDVLMTEGGDLDKLGRGTVWGDEVENCLHQNHVFAVRPDPSKLLPEYLALVTQSSYARAYFESTGTKTTNLASTSSSKIRDFRIPLVDLNEQRRITDFLDVETTRIDRLLDDQHRMIEIIEERRLALTSRLIYGRDQEGEKQDSTLPTVGLIPAGWDVVRIKTFMRETMELSNTGDEELLTVSHLTGVTPRSEKDVNMFMAESMMGYKRCVPGDLVINTLWAWMGALGVSRYYGIVSPAYGTYRMTSDAVDDRYLDLMVRTPEYVTEMTRFSKGVWTSRLRLYPESFLGLRVPVPSRHEQQIIVERINVGTSEQEQLKSKIRSFAILLAERRQALITAAVTEGITV